MDKKLILSKIKLHYGFKTETEFAKFLGISSNTLFNWYSRNTIDYERVVTKCVDIDANWIFTGVGNMLKSSQSINDTQDISNITKNNEDDYFEWKDKYISLLEKYNSLLEDKLIKLNEHNSDSTL